MTQSRSFDIQEFAASEDDGFGYRVRLGVIVLATDQTIEAEYASLGLPGVAWHYARIPMAITTNAQTLTSMHADLHSTAALIPKDFNLNAMGYACTSASTLIGDDRVAAQIHMAHPGVPCTNPILAGVTGLKQLGCRQIALLTPYAVEVTSEMAAHFERQRIVVAQVGSFLEPNELKVPRISTESIVDAARELGQSPDCDGVFIACTSLRTFSVVKQLEVELGKPVVTSNQSMAWHMLRLAGIEEDVPGLGRLFSLHL